MNWPLAILLAYLAISAAINIARIGKVRIKTKPEAIGDTVEYVILGALIIWAVVW